MKFNASFSGASVRTVCTLVLMCCASLAAQSTRPSVWISPPGKENGKCFRELFEHPEQWAQTRARTDVLFYADHNLKRHFTDEELVRWLPMLQQWKVKLAMEVGAIKPWGQTGEKCFALEKPNWERIERLGGKIHAIAMDEPLQCCRKQINKSDDYALQETAAYIAVVRKHFPDVLVGDIETYPSIPLEDHYRWIEALEKKLAELGVRGLDFYRVDVNWANFIVQNYGSWGEVRKIEQFCRKRKLPFGLIYWASCYPGLKKKGLADDSTWYVQIMAQGYDYAMVGGAPEQYVIESWVDAPSQSVPESDPFSFTRSVKDFVDKFVPRP